MGGRAKKRSHREVLRGLGYQRGDAWPRNAAAFEAIQQLHPEFSWEPVQRADGRRFIQFTGYPRDAAGRPQSLASLLRGDAEGELMPPVSGAGRVTPWFAAGAPSDAVVASFGRLLAEIEVCSPSREVAVAIRQWFEGARSGRASTVFCPVCPDYAVRYTGDPARPVEYTCDGVGDGVGLVAARILEVLPVLWSFCVAHGLDVRFVVAMSDFEADSAENRQRVGLSRDEFIARMRRSQQALRAACPAGMPIETPLVSEIACPHAWHRLVAEASANFAEGRWGPIEISDRALDDICRARRSLYSRWCGRELAAHEIRPLLLRQAPEYAAMGIYATSYPNSLILGADTAAMAAFYHALSAQPLPVIYLRRGRY